MESRRAIGGLPIRTRYGKKWARRHAVGTARPKKAEHISCKRAPLMATVRGKLCQDLSLEGPFLQFFRLGMSDFHLLKQNKQTNSVALSPRANYTD
jgi:hypothetical protein